MTIRRSFNELAYIGIGIVVFGGILATLSFVLKPKAVEILGKVLDIVKLHRRIWIGDLATMFATSRTDIELALMKLRERGEPILIDVESGEVSYSPQPLPGTSPS